LDNSIIDRYEKAIRLICDNIGEANDNYIVTIIARGGMNDKPFRKRMKQVYGIGLIFAFKFDGMKS
jgi:hypothetical protein